jgi:hypothetical protein
MQYAPGSATPLPLLHCGCCIAQLQTRPKSCSAVISWCRTCLFVLCSLLCIQAEEAVRRAEQQAAEAARRAAEREEKLRRAAEYEEPDWVKNSEAVASDSEVRMPGC